MAVFHEETLRRVSQIKMLAHYTSIRALSSILRTKELWFSSALDMNDISEVVGPTSTISASLAELGPEAFRLVPFHSTDAVRQFDAYRSKLDRQTFIFSLSDHGYEQDRVGMWGNYGHAGRGLCIVFRKEVLLDQRADGKFPAKWIPVTYGTSESLRKRVSDALEKIEAVFRNRRVLIQSLPPEKVGMIIAICLMTMVFTHKDASLEFEREVRFIYTDTLQFAPLPAGAGVRNVGDTDHPKKAFVLPLRHYPEWNVNAVLPELIDHIIVEPSFGQDERVREVRALLDEYGLQHVAVRASTSPFRAKKNAA